MDRTTSRRKDRWSQAPFALAFVLSGLLIAEASATACVSLDDLESDPQIPTELAPQEGPWHATYWNNTSMFGEPALVRNEASIDAFYADGSPGLGVNADNYSARWTRDIELPADVYRFTVTADDGVRIFLDGQMILDQWDLQDSATFNVEVPISAGNHRIVVEYFEHTGHSEIRVRMQGQQA